ncbi:hypothetical protein D9M68_467200 [compost metagenome]
MLGQGDDVHVALDDHDLVEVAVVLACLEQPVEFLALVEHRGFRGVQVFGLVIAQHAAAESDDAPAAVADGEHHPVAEAVVALAGLGVLDQQPRVDHVLLLQAVAAHMLEQVVPTGRGEAEGEVAGDLAREAAALEVFDCGLARGVLLQGVPVVVRSGGEQGVERGVGWLARAVAAPAFFPWDVHAGALGQVLDRLGEVQVVVVHDEAEGVAAGAAAEAVIELLVRADAEGWRLFVMEGAACGVVLAGLFQLHARADHFDYVGAVQQVVDEALGDEAGHGVLWAQEGSKHTRALSAGTGGRLALESKKLRHSPGRSGVSRCSICARPAGAGRCGSVRRSLLTQYRRSRRRCSRCTFLA